MNFGELVKNLRIAKQLTLRQCCAQLGADPSNWSRLERGVTPPPKDIGILANWATFFGLTGQEKQDFFDCAALSRRELPDDVASDERVLSVLPAFFRAVRGKGLEGEKLTQFIETVRALHSPAKDGRNARKGVGLGTR
jgi:transcriptional regulator with XRE-family HTH domain